MNHLDERTIHAWLDGALGAAESRDIETHVATCAACSAAVAEARGLVAGASRILNALDDVPAGVMPKQATARRPIKRHWKAAPWVTGIAAALVLAIGVTTFNRDAVVAPEKNSAPIGDTMGGAREAAAAAQRAAAPTAPAPSALPRGVPAAAVGAGVAAGAQVAAATDQKLERVTVTSAPAAAESMTMQKSAAEAPESDRFAGCYPMRSELRTTLRSAIPEAVAGRAASARGADRPAAPQAQYVAPRLPEIIRLDTVQRVPFGLLVRGAASDSTIGSWRVVAGDSVRVDLLSAGVFTFAGKDRVACPER